MKNLFLLSFAAIIFLGCKKNVNYENLTSNYIENLKADLEDSLSTVDYANLDFARSIHTTKDNSSCFFRVPFLGKKLSAEFVLLYTDTSGNIIKGSIIQLDKREVSEAARLYNGTIQ